MRKRAALFLLLVLPALSGCLGEELEVALRVPAGDVLRISGERTVQGSIVVEEGGRLLVESARLTVAQALVVWGDLAVRNSTILFEGPFQRHELAIRGSALFDNSRAEGLARAELGGLATFIGTSVRSGTILVHDGATTLRGGQWTLGRGDGFALAMDGGLLRMENATLVVGEGSGGISVSEGEVEFGNVSVDAARGMGPLLQVLGGSLGLTNATLVPPSLTRLVDVQPGGTLRLLDTPVDGQARTEFMGTRGRIEVLWTLTAVAESMPGRIPVGGLDLTLLSQGRAAGEAVTDEKGEARFAALETVYAERESRGGNPHVVQASGGGKAGASPAMVVNGPTRVSVPVLDAPTP